MKITAVKNINVEGEALDIVVKFATETKRNIISATDILIRKGAELINQENKFFLSSKTSIEVK